MLPSQNKDNEQKKSPSAMPSLPTGGDVAATKSNAIQIPQISLPKGGGAIKGIDEKFEVNLLNLHQIENYVDSLALVQVKITGFPTIIVKIVNVKLLKNAKHNRI